MNQRERSKAQVKVKTQARSNQQGLSQQVDCNCAACDRADQGIPLVLTVNCSTRTHLGRDALGGRG